MQLGKMVLSTFVALVALAGVSPAFGAFDSKLFNGGKEPLQILSINPTGDDVPASREIVIHFNRPVVPLGKMERDEKEIPISVVPTLACQWRWLNTSDLACQLGEKEAMTPATRYAVHIHPGIRAEDGSTLAQTVTHTFITERARVSDYRFVTWRSAGMPVIRVGFNQPVTEASAAAHLFIQTTDGRRWPVTVKEDEEYRKRSDYQPGRILLVTPVSELPQDASVVLKVERGIMPRKGSEPGAEERVVVAFDTFPGFSFLGVRCTSNGGATVTIRPGQKATSAEFCNPTYDVALLFSTPVLTSVLKESLKVLPDLARGDRSADPWEDMGDYSRLGEPHRKGDEYEVSLPRVLRVYQPYTIQADGRRIKDEFGRPLAKNLRQMFFTDHLNPDFNFGHRFAVLEKGVESELPIVVTNLAGIDVTYDVLTSQGKMAGQHKSLPVAKVQDVPYRMPLKAREMIGAESGVVHGSFETTPLVPNNSDNWFFAQVTPYNVQVKVGHFNTLVWVTDFATGLPVAGVAVDIYRDRFPGLDPEAASLGRGVTNRDGVALLAGTEKLDPELRALQNYEYSEEDAGIQDEQKDQKLFVRCQKGDDLALLPLVSAFDAQYYGDDEGYVYSQLQRRFGHIHTWGTTAQGVYRAGDTVQFKLFVRNQDNRVLVAPPAKGYTLQVMDPMDKVVYEVKELTLSEFGSYAGEFAVPQNGAVGWYRFVLSASFRKGEWQPMRVLVSDFTPAPFRVSTDLNGEQFKAGDTVKVTTQARLHAGGPYVNAQTRLTALLDPRPFASADPAARGFWFGDTLEGLAERQIYQTEALVNDKGDLEREFALLGGNVLYGQLTVESAVRDDRGKYVASRATALYVGRDRYVGLRETEWVLKKGTPARFETMVVDDHGKPVDGTPVEVSFEYNKTVASRVKGAGNAYLTHFEYEWVKAASCSVTSAATPVSCGFTPDNPGSYRITAEIKDSEGRAHKTVIQSWAVGNGVVVWGSEEGIGLQIVPEKKEYRVGERARYLVKNPYPGAKALISIERYGVLKSWVETFADSTAIVEFEVEPDFVPGFYLSVSVMSPRQEKPVDENQVDLGKPAFRIGYTTVPVRDPLKEILVEVKPDRQLYRPRDTVTVDIQAQLRPGSAKNLHPPMELAVVVLDEAVLDLIQGGKGYYDVYRGFYNLDPLDLRNFSLLMQLIGRQRFEKKGANPGGDGGPDLSMRSLFKFVSYWNPAVRTDGDGKARVSFPLPDNLTGWRVLVMAVNSGDRLGLGDASFKVNRPTEIRPVLPNQVLEGDSFMAGFSVMNRTDQERTIEVTISAEGALKKSGAGTGFSISQQVKAPPYKRTAVWLPVQTEGSGEIAFKARAWDKSDGDAIQQTLSVRKRVALETVATYDTTTADAVTEKIAFPTGIRTDAGGVSVASAPSVIANLEGAFAYLRSYPYICWEQILTKGVMAAQFLRLQPYLPDTMQWPESKGLPEETLKRAAEHQAPNGGICFYTASDEHVSPYLSAYTAIAFNWLRASGYAIPPQVEQKLHAYLLQLLRKDTLPSFYSKGMGSTVRAVALAALAPHGKVSRADLDRYRTHLPEMSLFGKAHYLQALLKVVGTADLQAEVVNMILAQANETGGKYIFSEKLDAGYAQLLTSTLRDNGAVLSALLAYGETPQGSKTVGAIPFKLVRTITQSRGQRDRWENTQENIFCLNALIDYSRLYERDKPQMTVRALLDGEKFGETSFKGFRDRPVVMERPLAKDDPGRTATVKLERQGSGRLYYGLRLAYAPLELKAKPVNAGIEVHREYSVERNRKWQLLKSPMQIRQGELVRVDLYVSLPAPRNFVVVDDPVPGGLEPVNRDLATASLVDADKGAFKAGSGSFWWRFGDWREYGYSYWSFYHRELRHYAARFYSEYLPAGNYHLAYTAQAIAPGEFGVSPLHAEEMYDPDVFGTDLPATLKVEKSE